MSPECRKWTPEIKIFFGDMPPNPPRKGRACGAWCVFGTRRAYGTLSSPPLTKVWIRPWHNAQAAAVFDFTLWHRSRQATACCWLFAGLTTTKNFLATTLHVALCARACVCVCVCVTSLITLNITYASTQ